MQQETIIEVMQPKGCEVVFRNLSFSVEIKNKKKKRFETKTILEDVSGVFRAGRLTAVMGASGAGKTSLLQVLAGQLHVGQLSGEVLLNNEPVIGMGMKKISGFVFQDDVILSTMTVHEAVSMSATLRLSKKTTAEEKAKKVANVIKLLNLEKCQNTIIGDDSKKGISGGERKRCAMAMEIITNPAILFLDEPTSGLDTFTAHSCVAILKNLAASGNTIVSTIHQPSSDIYHMFDDLLLLSEGRVMYQGPCEDAVSYFSRLNFICPQYCNPADYLFMSILNNEDQSKDGSSDKEKESNKDRLERLLAYWAGSEENKKILLITANPATGGVSKSSYKEKSAFITQFGYLAGRASKNAFRNPFIFRSKLAQYVIISLIIGLLYLRLNLRTDTSASTNRTGVLFFVAVNNVMQNAIGVLSIFGLEKAVFRRENGAGYYSLSAYFLTKVMVEIPFQILFPWMGATMIYWMVGLQATVAKYFICMLFAVLCSISGFGMGIFFASVFANIPTALAVAPLVLLPFMLFSGLFATSDSIPPYFDWIKYISPMKYGFEGMFKNEFTGLSLPSPDGRKNIDGTPVFLDGSVFIKNIGLDDGISIQLCAILLFVIAFFCILSGYLALSYIVYKQGRPITLSKKESKGRIMPGVAVESKAK